MRIDNLNFHPVRLQTMRTAQGCWRIKRATEEEWLGMVKFTPNDARANRDSEPRPWTARPEDRNSSTYHRSFRTAALRIARMNVSLDSDGVQDFGQCRVLRMGAWGFWYTVVLHNHGPWIYEDDSIQRVGKTLPERKQAELRAVINAAEKFQKENL